ncbi:MAG: tetratricopeptide repeat protein [Puniceicoccaceae bacterium]
MPSSSKPRIRQQRPVLLGLATVSRMSDGTTRFRFALGKLSVCLLIIGILTWVCVFSAAYFHFKFRRGYAEASYLETLFFPFTHASFQKKRGYYYIEAAFDSMESGDLREALHLLRNGLLRVPDHLIARKTLSEFYEFALKRPELALSLVVDGIKFLPGVDETARDAYLQHLFALANRNEFDAAVIEAGQRILQHEDLQLSRSMRALVSYQIAAAHRNLGDTETTRHWLQQHQLLQFAEGRALQAQLLADEGKISDSIALLQSHLDTFHENTQLHEKLIELLVESNQPERARRFALVYALEHRENFRAQLTHLRLQYQHSDPMNPPARMHNWIDEYFAQFHDDAEAMRQLAILTSRFGDVPQTERAVAAHAQLSPQFPQHLSQFILIEARLRSRDYAGTLGALEALESTYRTELEESPDSHSILLSLKAAAYQGTGDAFRARQSLDALLSLPSVGPDRYLAVAQLFLELGNPETARQIAEHCLQKHPSNSSLRETLITLYLQQRDAPALLELLRQEMDKRRLPNQQLVKSYRLLSSDRFQHLNGRDQILAKIKRNFPAGFLVHDL